MGSLPSENADIKQQVKAVLCRQPRLLRRLRLRLCLCRQQRLLRRLRLRLGLCRRPRGLDLLIGGRRLLLRRKGASRCSSRQLSMALRRTLSCHVDSLAQWLAGAMGQRLAKRPVLN